MDNKTQDTYDALIEFVERQVDQRRLVAIVVMPLSAVALLVTLGLLPSGLVAARLVVAAVVAVFLVVLGLRNRTLRSQLREQRDGIIKFAGTLVGSDTLAFDIDNWTESHVIKKDLCLTEREITIRNTGADPLLVCWHGHKGPHGSKVMSEATQRNVNIRIREVEKGQDGIDCRIWPDWTGVDVRVYIVFPEPIPVGGTRTIKISIGWPGWHSPLIEAKQEEYGFKFHRTVRNFKFSLTFDPSIGITRKLVVKGTGGLPNPTSEFVNGQAVVKASWAKPPSKPEFTVLIQK